jgi:hypothetical protein
MELCARRPSHLETPAVNFAIPINEGADEAFLTNVALIEENVRRQKSVCGCYENI